MKKEKSDVRITVTVEECHIPDKITADMGMLNEIAIAFYACAELNAMRGFDALAARYRRRCDQITDSLRDRGFYDDTK